MKFSEWISALDQDDDLPDEIADARPVEFICLMKVLDPEEGVCLMTWRSESMSFWEAIGMAEEYKMSTLRAAES